MAVLWRPPNQVVQECLDPDCGEVEYLAAHSIVEDGVAIMVTCPECGGDAFISQLPTDCVVIEEEK